MEFLPMIERSNYTSKSGMKTRGRGWTRTGSIWLRKGTGCGHLWMR